MSDNSKVIGIYGSCDQLYIPKMTELDHAEPMTIKIYIYISLIETIFL